MASSMPFSAARAKSSDRGRMVLEEAGRGVEQTERPGDAGVGRVEQRVGDTGGIELARLVRLVHRQGVDVGREVGLRVETVEQHLAVVGAAGQAGVGQHRHDRRRDVALDADGLAFERGQVGRATVGGDERFDRHLAVVDERHELGALVRCC